MRIGAAAVIVVLALVAAGCGDGSKSTSSKDYSGLLDFVPTAGPGPWTVNPAKDLTLPVVPGDVGHSGDPISNAFVGGYRKTWDNPGVARAQVRVALFSNEVGPRQLLHLFRLDLASENKDSPGDQVELKVTGLGDEAVAFLGKTPDDPRMRLHYEWRSGTRYLIVDLRCVQPHVGCMTEQTGLAFAREIGKRSGSG